MATGRRLGGKRLAIIAAFAVLLVAAFGAGCNGFFTGQTLTNLYIDGPTAVQVGSSITLSPYGVYGSSGGGNGQCQNLTSGVSWSSTEPTVAEVTGTCATATCGSVTIQGVSAGTASIGAATQAVTASATITVFLPTPTDYQICQGTFAAPTGCSATFNWTAPNDSSGPVDTTFIVEGTSGGIVYDLTASSTWTPTGTPPSGFTCELTDGVSPETCTVPQGATGPIPVTVTYPAGVTPATNTATLNITATD